MTLKRLASEPAPIVAALAVFLVVWQAIVLLGELSAVHPARSLRVLDRFARAWAQGTLQPHALTTLLEVALGLSGRAATGLAIGILLARSRLAERLLSPYIVAAQATPILALAPLIALWFGSGLASKVADLRADRLLPDRGGHDGRDPIGRRTAAGAGSQPARDALADRCTQAPRSRRPCRRSSAGCRVGVTLAVVGAIVGEWAGGDRGLGVLINLARGSLFDIPLMFATLLTIALIGVALYLAVVLVERRLVGTVGVKSLAGGFRALRSPPSCAVLAVIAIAAGSRARHACIAEPAPDRADGGPGLHPQRPVRAVLLRRSSRATTATPGWTSRSRTATTPQLITLVGQGAVDIGIGDGTSVIPAASQGIPAQVRRHHLRPVPQHRASRRPRPASRRPPTSRAGSWARPGRYGGELGHAPGAAGVGRA